MPLVNPDKQDSQKRTHPEHTEYTYKELRIYYSANIDNYNYAAMSENPEFDLVILTWVELTDFVVWIWNPNIGLRTRGKKKNHSLWSHSQSI